MLNDVLNEGISESVKLSNVKQTATSNSVMIQGEDSNELVKTSDTRYDSIIKL